MTRKQRLSEHFAEANLTAATIISADPMNYPEGSLMSQMAGGILSHAANEDDSDCGPLFEVA